LVPHWADVTMAVAAVGSLLVTAIGLIALYIQIKKLRDAIWGDTNGRLCEQSFELLKFLAEKPETYDYFYVGKPLEDDHPNKVFILYACEAMANFLEHVVLQRGNLPKHQWVAWSRYIRSTYEASPAIREFIEINRDWYSDDLIKLIAEYNQNRA
jgi:hypothetical protein